VPVAIRNNTEHDHEAEVRERFQEPSWNNPVVRILGARGEDLVPRLHRRQDWSRAAVSRVMVEALAAREQAPPAWLVALRDEELPAREGLGRALFGMP